MPWTKEACARSSETRRGQADDRRVPTRDALEILESVGILPYL